MEDIKINTQLTVPVSSLRFNFSRSGGKGGQHVNKVSTKVELIADIRAFDTSPEIKSKIRSRLEHRIDTGGFLHVVSQDSRSQWQNRNRALEKFITLLEEALLENPERTPTKRTVTSVQKKMRSKHHRSILKKSRSKNIFPGDE